MSGESMICITYLAADNWLLLLWRKKTLIIIILKRYSMLWEITVSFNKRLPFHHSFSMAKLPLCDESIFKLKLIECIIYYPDFY